MRAVWPCVCSLALTSAPRAISALTAPALPVRDAVIRAVSPLTRCAFGFAPALSSASTIGTLPFSHASAIGVTPRSFAAFTLAPARIRRSAVVTSSQWAAQCSAVAPSGCAALTSTRCLSSASTDRASRRSTACTRRWSGPVCAATAVPMSGTKANAIKRLRAVMSDSSDAGRAGAGRAGCRVRVAPELWAILPLAVHYSTLTSLKSPRYLSWRFFSREHIPRGGGCAQHTSVERSRWQQSSWCGAPRLRARSRRTGRRARRGCRPGRCEPDRSGAGPRAARSLLRDVPQRAPAHGGAHARQHRPRKRRTARRNLGEGAAQDPGGPDAAGGPPAAGRRGIGFLHERARNGSGARVQRGAQSRTAHRSPPESNRVHQQRSRPPRARDRRPQPAAGRRYRRARVRQQRGCVDGVARPRRPVPLGGAQDQPPRDRTLDGHDHRDVSAAAPAGPGRASRRAPPVRIARRHGHRALLPGRRRVRGQDPAADQQLQLHQRSRRPARSRGAPRSPARQGLHHRRQAGRRAARELGRHAVRQHRVGEVRAADARRPRSAIARQGRAARSGHRVRPQVVGSRRRAPAAAGRLAAVERRDVRLEPGRRHGDRRRSARAGRARRHAVAPQDLHMPAARRRASATARQARASALRADRSSRPSPIAPTAGR